jgi:tRNA(His) 5'-end guanylyltransferase
MSDTTALGDRMKAYEQVTRYTLPRRTNTIIRVDGKAFHTLLRAAEKPFDTTVMLAMTHTMRRMCEQIQGVAFGYSQSDEISLLLTDFSSTQSQPWFGGNLQKMISISAAIATAEFNRVWKSPVHELVVPPLGLFDARVYTIPDPIEVANYFVWRQRDATRNSISMAAQAHFSHKSLQRLSSGQLQEKLWAEAGVNWNDYPGWAKRGSTAFQSEVKGHVSFLHPETNERVEQDYVRNEWASDNAVFFQARPETWLPSHIPGYPQEPAPVGMVAN